MLSVTYGALPKQVQGGGASTSAALDSCWGAFNAGPDCIHVGRGLGE